MMSNSFFMKNLGNGHNFATIDSRNFSRLESAQTSHMQKIPELKKNRNLASSQVSTYFGSMRQSFQMDERVSIPREDGTAVPQPSIIVNDQSAFHSSNPKANESS